MFLKSILINLLLVASVYCGIVRNKRSSNNKCLLTLSHDEFEPLLIFRDRNSSNHKYLRKHYAEIEIEMNESVWLSCAPFKLKQFPDKQLVEATCKTEQTFEIDGIEMEFSDLKCEQAAIQYYEHPVDGCKANDEYKSVKSVQESFYDPINNITYVTAEICYDDVKENIIFSHYKFSYENQSLMPLNFQNGQFIVPLYKPSIYNMEKSFENNRRKLTEIRIFSYTDQNALNDLTSRMAKSVVGGFIAKTNYKLEESFDLYFGQFGEDNNNSWNALKKDENVFASVESKKKLSFDVNKVCPGGEGEIFKVCKYDDIQKSVFGMPELKIN